jgi:hypothetical protein
MSGNIAMNSVARMTGLLRPSALGQPMRVDEATAMMPLTFYSVTPHYGWTIHPDTLQTGGSLTVGAFNYAIAFSVPYDCTITSVKYFIQAQATTVTAGTIALMNATTTLASVSGASLWTGGSGTVQNQAFSSFSGGGSSISLTAGIYWIVFSATVTSGSLVLQAGPAPSQTSYMNMNQSPATNSLANSRIATVTSIPAVGSSLGANPSHSNITRVPFFAIY